MEFQPNHSVSCAAAIMEGGAHTFVEYISVIFAVAVILFVTAPCTDFTLYAVGLSFTFFTKDLVDGADVAAYTASSGKDDV